MICKWLHRQPNATNVIVFFSGWGFGETIVAHLKADSDTDVLFVYDYTQLDNALSELNNYRKRTLIAWSFGVGNYLLWQKEVSDVHFDKKVAINGTPQAINRKMGIAEKVVSHTIERLCPQTFQEFVKRCGGKIVSPSVLNDAQINLLKIELESIKQRGYPEPSKVNWDKAWISQHDQIFPIENQQRAWQDTPQTVINASHNVFDIWSDWQDLLA